MLATPAPTQDWHSFDRRSRRDWRPWAITLSNGSAIGHATDMAARAGEVSRTPGVAGFVAGPGRLLGRPQAPSTNAAILVNSDVPDVPLTRNRAELVPAHRHT